MRILIGGTPKATLYHVTVEEYVAHCGMLTSWRDASHPRHAAAIGAPWALDNYAYKGFNAKRYASSLKRYHSVPGCLFAAVPDVVGDAEATMKLFWEWHDEVRNLGYPVALVIQNWLTADQVPWEYVDAIFVGGDDQYKFSPQATEIVREANHLGLWTHVGRINGRRRWTYALGQNAKSVDGSGLASVPRRILEAFSVLERPDQFLFPMEGA